MYIIILAFLALAVSLVWYLLQHDHGRKLPVATLWYASGFGVLAMVFASGLETWLIPAGFVQTPSLFSHPTQLSYFMEIGFIEEAAKFVPLAIFIYKRDYFREHTDGCIYFAICGLTFGLGENILYTAMYGSSVGVARLVMTPFFHAATTSIIGYYLVNRKLRRDKQAVFLSACLLVPALHGLYDFGLGAGIAQLMIVSMMVTMLFTMCLFLYFSQANLLDRHAIASRPLGYVGVPIVTQQQYATRYCEQCGQENVYRRPYCESCGRKL